MNLATIALKNLKRNFSFYSLYLVSVSFVLMIYFCFTSFSMNEIIMEKISSDGRVEMMCSVVAVFIMAFVVFYMFYSNNFFMRRRMKELGIYALLGYRKGDMLRLLTIENIFVCLGGMFVGILAGSLLHIGITAGIVALLGLTIDINDLATLKPELADEWSSKNDPLKPTMVTTGSHKKVIWQDKYGHEWTATVKSRALNGTGCPYCSHNKILCFSLWKVSKSVA